jgi:hypothetical protein
MRAASDDAQWRQPPPSTWFMSAVVRRVATTLARPHSLCSAAHSALRALERAAGEPPAGCGCRSAKRPTATRHGQAPTPSTNSHDAGH